MIPLCRYSSLWVYAQSGSGRETFDGGKAENSSCDIIFGDIGWTDRRRRAGSSAHARKRQN